jgi:F-type H+-transporting ATPase subunit delta
MSAITSRYARAFVDVVFSSKLEAAKVTADLRSVLAVVDESVELKIVWANPSIPPEQKRKLLDAITARLGVQREVRNFIAVLIDHHRIAQLAEITEQFEHDVNERLGLAEAEITSARQLSDSERRDLEMQIASLTGKRVLAKYSTDTHLLGGAVVRIGDTIYDGSVRGRLARIREELSAG